MNKIRLLIALLLGATPLWVQAADADRPPGEAQYTAQETEPKGVTPRPGINVGTEPEPGQAADTDAAPDYKGDETDPKGVTPRPGINVDVEPPKDEDAPVKQLGSPADPDTSISTGSGAGGG